MKSSRPPKASGLRVLVIDDDPLVHRMLARALTSAGHTASCVESVREGLRAFPTGQFDAVITDIYMPDEDGLDALRQLRAASPTVPIIVLSGQLNDSFGTTLKGVVLNLGAFAAIPKDTNCLKVVEVLDRLVNGGAEPTKKAVLADSEGST